MITGPTVSVIIPTFNRAALLPRALDSVVAQTYEPVEIVVVDDGSTDETAQVLRTYSDRVRLVNTNHKGPSHARNAGMRAATGRYIAFLDSDDSYYPAKLAAQVEIIEARPDIGMVCTEVSGVFPNGETDLRHLRRYHPTYERKGWSFEDVFAEKREVTLHSISETATLYEGDIFPSVIEGTLVMSNTVLFRRDLLDVVGYQNEAHRFGEDYEFVARICKHVRVGFLDIPTYKLHYHDDQMTRFLTKSRGERKAEADLKLEAWHVLLGTVTELARDDAAYYSTHRTAVDVRLAELHKEIGYLWAERGDWRKSVHHLGTAYRLENKALSSLRCRVAPLWYGVSRALHRGET